MSVEKKPRKKGRPMYWLTIFFPLAHRGKKDMDPEDKKDSEDALRDMSSIVLLFAGGMVLAIVVGLVRWIGSLI